MKSNQEKCKVKYHKDHRYWFLEDGKGQKISYIPFHTQELAIAEAHRFFEETGSELYIYDEFETLLVKKKGQEASNEVDNSSEKTIM